MGPGLLNLQLISWKSDIVTSVLTFLKEVMANTTAIIAGGLAVLLQITNLEQICSLTVCLFRQLSAKQSHKEGKKQNFIKLCENTDVQKADCAVLYS